MILTLLCIALIAYFCVVRCVDKYTMISINVDVEISAFISGIFGITGMVLIVIILLCNYCGVDHDIHLAQMEREKIMQQIEIINTEYEDVSKTQVIESVCEWNEDVYSTHWLNNNPWTNWFINDRYDESLQEIDISLTK